MRKKQLGYILAPSVLLLLCLVFINVAPRLFSGSPAVQSGAALPAVSNNYSGDGMATAVPPTPTPSLTPSAAIPPSPTAYLPPTLPPHAVINLLGPPQDSAFRHEDAISFYWSWPVPLPEDQRLSLYARLDGQETLLGTVEEPNLGVNYRLQTKAGAIAATGSMQWIVRLQSTAVPQSFLAESEARNITILP